eukprot:g636.t1
MKSSEIEIPSQSDSREPPLRESLSLIQKKGWNTFTSLNGTSRAFTISVLTTLALAITTLYFDREFLQNEKGTLLDHITVGQPLSAAFRRIFRALVLLFFCVVIALIAFGLIGVNVYPFKQAHQIRLRIWMIASFICAVMCSALGVIVIVDTEIKFQEREDEHASYQSKPAHYFLVSCFGLSILWMDYLFITVVFVGKYLELQQQSQQQVELTGWARVKNRLSRITSLGRKPPTEDFQTFEHRPHSFRQKVTFWCWKRFTSLVNGIVDGLYHSVLFLQRCLGVKKTSEVDGAPENVWKSMSIEISDTFIYYSNFILDSYLIRTLHGVIKFVFWDFWRPMRDSMNNVREMTDSEKWYQRGSSQIVHMIDSSRNSLRTFRYSFRSTIDDLYDSVRENEEFKHSGWVLAAIITSLVLLVYFGVATAMNISAYLNEEYIDRRNCVIHTIDDNGDLGNLILRIAGFTEASEESDRASRRESMSLRDNGCSVDFNRNRSLNLSSPECLGSESIVNDLLQVMNQVEDPFINNLVSTTERFEENKPEDRIYSCPLQGFSNLPCYTLSVINMLESSTSVSSNETRTPTNIFHDHAVGKAIYLMDATLRNFRYTLWIGWLFGLIVGVYSLLSVLGQYKRLSLAIRSGMFTDLKIPTTMRVSGDQKMHIGRVKSVISEPDWAKIIELYPMGLSVFFFGILVSTAVIQLFAIGGAISLILAFLVSVFDPHVFMILRPFLAMLIAFLITWALNGPVAQAIVSEGILVKKYYIYHEFAFLMFLLVYTALHLVLGVFIALIRLIWVLLTTIASLNRLDKNLFPMLKRFDLGHKSFMSMILMHHAFQANACAEEELMRRTLGAFQDNSDEHRESQKKTEQTPQEPPQSNVKIVTFATPEAKAASDDLPPLPII